MQNHYFFGLIWKALIFIAFLKGVSHLRSPREISGRYLSKKKLVIFQEICDRGYAKKVKKSQIFKKFFFRSKQPKAP